MRLHILFDYYSIWIKVGQCIYCICSVHVLNIWVENFSIWKCNILFRWNSSEKTRVKLCVALHSTVHISRSVGNIYAFMKSKNSEKYSE